MVTHVPFSNKPGIALLQALNYMFSGIMAGYFLNVIWLDAFFFYHSLLTRSTFSLKRTFCWSGTLCEFFCWLFRIFILHIWIRNTVQTIESTFFTKFLAKIFNGVYFNRTFVNTTKLVYPHIYSDIQSLVVVPTFFLSKQITRRECLIYGMRFFLVSYVSI